MQVPKEDTKVPAGFVPFPSGEAEVVLRVFLDGHTAMAWAKEPFGVCGATLICQNLGFLLPKRHVRDVLPVGCMAASRTARMFRFHTCQCRFCALCLVRQLFLFQQRKIRFGNTHRNVCFCGHRDFALFFWVLKPELRFFVLVSS